MITPKIVNRVCGVGVIIVGVMLFFELDSEMVEGVKQVAFNTLGGQVVMVAMALLLLGVSVAVFRKQIDNYFGKEDKKGKDK